MTILIFLSLFVVLMLVVAKLQRKEDVAERARTGGAILTAKKTGTHEPLMQHPLIDVVQCLGCGSCVAACPEGDVLGLVEGKAAIVNGARCIGHGRCAEVCPVGAIRIGLGELAARDDIPTVTAWNESTVPGLYLAGELTGIALIRHAVGHGVRAIEHITDTLGKSRRVASTDVLDVAIVGAGPAGLSAALKAVETGLTHILLEQEEAGGTILHFPKQKLVLTQPVTLPLYGRLKRSEYRKEELVRVWKEVLVRYPVKLRTGVRLLDISRVDGAFRISTSSGVVAAHRVVLALGRRGTPRKLGVPGEELEKVAYRLVDAASYAGNRVLVVGGGDSAVEAALGLSEQPGTEVTLAYRKAAFFRIKRRNQTMLDEATRAGRVRLRLESEPSEIRSDAVILSTRGKGGERDTALANDFVFVFAGGVPPFDLLRRTGVAFGGRRAGHPNGTDGRDPAAKSEASAVGSRALSTRGGG